MTGATNLWKATPGSRTTSRVSAPIAIGFPFRLDAVTHSQLIVYSSGIVTLGTNAVTSPTVNRLSTISTPPIIAPFWDALPVVGDINGCAFSEVNYRLVGEAPHRVFIVQWKDAELVSSRNAWGTFEARLYETSNQIDFYYERMSPCDLCNMGRGCGSTTASIGLATSTSNWLSLSPSTGWVPNTRTVNNSVNINVTPIKAGTLISLAPCNLMLVGRTGPGNGGTISLANGDTFFQGFVQQMGAVVTYRPFEAMMTSIICNASYTATITGPAASDFYFGTPGTTSYVRPLTPGLRDTMGITFSPTTTGVRNATLTVTGPGLTRTFNMSITVPLVNYIGHTEEGGTEQMAANDTIFQGMPIWRHTSRELAPFSLRNMSLSTQNLSVAINDPTGQYSVNVPATIGAGEVITPTFTFAPTGFGPQPARLTVTVGNESRSFTMRAISAAPGGSLYAVGEKGEMLLDSNASVFQKTYGCVGEQVNSIPILMVNEGYEDFLIQGVEIYRTDTAYGQGVPRYPFLRDEDGALVPSEDYILTESPAVAPLTANQANYPLAVPQGESRTFYLTFISSRPEKRFARIFIKTNGESSAGHDTSGMLVEGMVSFDLFGRGMGGLLSDRPNGGLPSGVVFPPTYLDESSTQMLRLVNPGLCTLRIGLREMAIDRGDIEEFAIVSLPDNIIDPVTNDLLIPPGESDTMVFRFTPRQVGSRRASLRLITNDSTVQIPSITERGMYYIDLHGMGTADLYGTGIRFGEALIGGGAEEHLHDVVRVSNTRTEPVVIAGVVIEGTDAGEFSEDAAKPWPAMPYVLNSGGNLELGVTFAPVAGGTAGDRNAVLKAITAHGDTIVAALYGIGGTREIMVNPTGVNFGILTVGKQSRRTVMIGNGGTMKLTLQQPEMSPGSDFTFGAFPRLELDPGQVEYLEVTYMPSAVGASNATLKIGNNGTTGEAVITLSGAGLKAKYVDADPGRTARGDDEGGVDEERGESEAVSGVELDETHGMALRQSVPNPARDQMEIGYLLNRNGHARLAIYDSEGRMVRMLVDGNRTAGEHQVRVDLRDLPNGVYHYRLTGSSGTLSRIFHIVR